ncbi:MAG: hypothetical protein ACXAEU_04965 [Candidatus Hodarchaeales archaeon]
MMTREMNHLIPAPASSPLKESTIGEETVERKVSSSNERYTVVRVLVACFHTYTGDPLWVTGHALRRALKVSNPVSNGIFTMATTIPEVKTYDEYFKLRLDPEPLMYVEYMGFGWDKKFSYLEYKPTCLTFDINGKNDRIKPGTWFITGGRKNHGHGRCKILEVQEINLQGLVYPERVEWARLVSPMAMKSLPRHFLRQRIRIDDQWFYHERQRESVSVADAGQVFKLKLGMNKYEQGKMLLKGITRVGYRSRVGLGEYYCF